MNLRKNLYLLPVLILALIFNSCKDNTTDPPETSSRMNLVSKFDTPGYAQDITIHQQGINYAFVADDNSGLQIINVSTPSSPMQVGTYNTTGSAVNVRMAQVSGKLYAFIADGAAGLTIVDVTVPQQPVLDTVITFANDNVVCSFIESSTNRAYIGTYYKMYIYDISNLPNNITQLSNYNVVDNLNSIWVDGGVAYLAENTAGVELVNITNPAFPVYISSFNSPGFAMDVRVSGNYAYIADYTSFIVLNVTNPFNPSSAGSYYSQSSQYAVFTSLVYNNNGVFYTAEGPAGAEAIGVGSPTAPAQVGYYITNDYAGGIDAVGSYVFVADGNDGLVILQYTAN